MKLFALVVLVTVLFYLLAACGGVAVTITENRKPSPEPMPSPPIAEKIPHRTSINGVVLEDNYYWLKDKSRKNPKVRAYIEAENAYTDAMTAHTKPLQENLYKEMISRIKQDDSTVPVRINDYYYFWRYEKGLQYRTLCRQKGSLQAPVEVILDINKEAEGHSFYSVGETAVSENGRFLAYNVDTNGSEVYNLYVKDLAHNTQLPFHIERADSFTWANDNKHLLYTTVDETIRSDKIFVHQLGSPVKSDTLLYHEKDQKYYVWVEKSRSKKFILLGSASSTTSEIRLMDADEVSKPPVLVAERTQGVEYDLAHSGDIFFIRTNRDNAKNFKIMTAPVSDPSPSQWRELIPHRNEVFINLIDAFKDSLVLMVRKNGLPDMELRDLQGHIRASVNWKEPTYSLYRYRTPQFDSRLFRITYESLITPSTVYDVDMHSGELKQLKQEQVLGGYSPHLYTSELRYAPARDGEQIPVSIAYRKDRFKWGTNPLLLYAYGAYGYSTSAYFSSTRLSLLDRGVVFAFAHIRGGREKGDQWYEQGHLLNKKNTFYDFIDVADYLVKTRFTRRDKLMIQGGSAGGLLIGAVLNYRPDLCHVAVAEVPFVDVLNTMLDPSLSATVTEYEEWGNPNEKEYFDYIRSYCPYQNVGPYEYPHILIFAGFYDPRVNYWEPAKWTAKLRAMKKDSHLILLKTNMEGHMGPSGRFDYYREIAFQYAVMLDLLKLK